MTTESEAKRLADGALAAARGRPAEVSVRFTDAALTRFANNEIHQNVAERSAAVSVRVGVGRRWGTASTNDLSDGGVQKAVAQASEIAQALPTPTATCRCLLRRRRSPWAATTSTPPSTAPCSAPPRYGRSPARRRTRGSPPPEPSGPARTAPPWRTRRDSSSTTPARPPTSWRSSWTTTRRATPASFPRGSATSTRRPSPMKPRPRPSRAVPLGACRRATTKSYSKNSPSATCSTSWATSASGAWPSRRGGSFMSGRLGEAVMGPNVSIWDDPA